MNIIKRINKEAKKQFGCSIEDLDTKDLHTAVASAIMKSVRGAYGDCQEKHFYEKTAYYMSAEFLMGRAVYSNIVNLGIEDDIRQLFCERGIDYAKMEEIEDDALGNGGLGRLAACFLDSAASMDLPLHGYGIRYKYGLFKQAFSDGFQKELADDWTKWGDPWSIRQEEEAVTVAFADMKVRAVPYDMAIIGYGGKTVNRLRLWQSEATDEFDFQKFDEGKYAAAYKRKIEAEKITAVLYPNDSSEKGKRLRLMQEYFFTSASMQDLLLDQETVKHPIETLSDYACIQLNDTHPVLAVPELIRLIKERGKSFEEALEIAKKVFAYTNHTIMSEASEKWKVSMLKRIIPNVYDVIVEINDALVKELKERGADTKGRLIIDGGLVYMARLACFVAKKINGVAKIHTEIIKSETLKEWYELYPEKFVNVTNGISFRRWLQVANPELAEFVTVRIGDEWKRDWCRLRELADHDAYEDCEEFIYIKRKNKWALVEYMKKKEGIEIDKDYIFDVQIKRIHEYKRQLLNAFSILAIYNGIKDGSIKDFPPTLFIIGGKAAPSYRRAKGIIKYINEIAAKINSDPEVKDKIKVVFVTDYNVSYAEKIVAAADISEQISTAGTEASGTGNMKLMLNGAVTLGTYDGANIEIAEAAGIDNIYIFGARVEDIAKIRDSYDPVKIYKNSPVLKKVVDSLVDGTFSDGGTGMFKELYDSLLVGASWHRPDNYFLLLDFDDYLKTKLRALSECLTRKFVDGAYRNVCTAGRFSSDRTIYEYAKLIWEIV